MDENEPARLYEEYWDMALNHLLQTLKQEKNCDTLLAKLAKTEINLKAV